MIREAMRRIRNVIASGVTTGPVTVGLDNVPRVQVRVSAIEVLTLPIVEQRGVASGLPVGTPVSLSFLAGDRSNGSVTGSTAPKTRPAVFAGEDHAIYGYGYTVWIKPDGVHITAPDVFISGDLHVSGEVTAKAGSGASVTLSQHKGHDGGGQAPTSGT